MSNHPNQPWCTWCGCLMVRRRGKRVEFFGCTGYPICRNTMNLREAEDCQSAQPGEVYTDETETDT